MSESSAPGVPEGWKVVPPRPGFFGRSASYFYRHVAPGTTHWAFRADESQVNPNGTVHGGLLMTFADHVGGAATDRAIAKRPCATVSLNADFLASARPGDWVEGAAEVTRSTRSLVLIRASIWVGDKTILTATGIWKILGDGRREDGARTASATS